MKKRITALLLCLVMVFSLIPTTVWAASNSTVVLHPSFGNTVTGVKVKVGDKIDGHAITSISGYDITVDLGKYNVNNDTFKLPYAKDIWEGVDNNKVDYINWAGGGSNKRSEGASALLVNGKNTAYYYFKGAPVLLTFTLNYDANGGTGAPASQTYKATSQYEKSHTFTISLQEPTREDYTFLGWSTSSNATSASYQPNGSIVVTGTTTLYAVWEQKQHEHKDNDGDGFCDKDNTCMHPKNDDGNCTVPGCTHPDSCCPKKEDPKPPTEPTGTPTFTDVNGHIRVQCTAYPSNHEPHAKMYGITSEDDYIDNGVAQNGDTFTYSIELKRARFIDKFDADTNREHEDEEPNEKAIVTWRWDDNQWKLISGPDGITADIECICKKEIVPPTDGPTDADVKAALGNVTVKCINPGTKHTPCAYWALGGNDGYQLTKNDDGTYNVVVNAAPFVKAYSPSDKHTQKQAHNLASADTLTWVLTFDKESSKWVGAPKVIGVDDTILVTHAPKDYKEVGKIADKDDVITTKCVNSNKTANKFGITVGFTPNVADKLTVVYTGNGTYKATFSVENCVTSITKDNGRCTHTERQHDLLTKELVTWLLSVKVDGKGGYVWSAAPETPGKDDVCNVAHRVKVTFDENYENAPTTDVMYKYNTAEVKEGTIPTAPDRTGYTFKGWNTKKDGTGETFNAATFVANTDVTYYAQWEINTYNIAATLYMNGADSSVQETGKTYPWSHRYGGEYGKHIDYTDMFAALKAKALEVDAANKPYDAEIKLCFPKSDKLFNETIKTYGQDGAFWNPGVKNTAYIWGHATTSYEVIFNTGDGSKVDTQIVKYGELAAEPTTELKGYDFLGWFDADGNEFDFDTPITHKTTLTAKWEKKTYIIASDLRINGGDANLADGKTYPWSYRYGGKFEETIDYEPMIAALKTRAMEVDAANGPVDSVVTLCFPGNDPATAKKLFNKTILTYGQDGGGWNPGNKNTAPIWGFATNVYAVTFNYKDDKTATATQNVEYGNMATEPQKVDRPGYRFLGWFTDEECTKKFEFTTPITKSMTLYAGWEIIPHDIYAFANVNSAFAPLTPAEFADQLVLNAATLSRLGLSYNGNNYVSISKFNFNGMPLTEDLYMAYYDDPEFDAVVAALKDESNAGSLEVSKDIADKIDWESLYETTYGDLPVGYPTTDKDSYQLSGNLNLATVMFDAGDIGDDKVEGMPAVNYTYDDVIEIHDFYFAGDTFTMPADPTREAYDFLGWRAVVIPSENDKDAKCLADDKTGVDGDANTNTGDEKLYKAGETYTITEGGVRFVAQWKIKTYNVKFVSFDSVVATQVVEHGKTAERIKNPEVNDYVFKGWYLNGQLYDFNTPVTSDITLVAQWVTKTSNSSGGGTTTKKDNGKTVQSGKTFDGGIALYVGLSVLSVTGSAWVITKKKRG